MDDLTPPAAAAHRAERYYSECQCLHPDLLDDAIPEDVAAGYESAYYDAHFTVGDDFESCNAAFSGWGCPACADEVNDDFRAWTSCPWYDPDAPLPESQYADYPPAPCGTDYGRPEDDGRVDDRTDEQKRDDLLEYGQCPTCGTARTTRVTAQDGVTTLSMIYPAGSPPPSC